MAAPGVRYRITPQNPSAHLFDVTVTVDKPDPAGQRFWLPVWIPGSYLVREFARHVVSVSATAGGEPLSVEKVDKHTWQTGAATQAVTLQATIYAWDLSVRAAHLDQSHAFFNGTSVFPAVAGQEEEPVEVVIEPPPDPACQGWKVATTLPAVDAPGAGFGRYRADNYQHLVDHPVELGSFVVVSWAAGGVPHEMAITGRVRVDQERLAHDLSRVCAEQIRLFHGEGAAAEKPPMQRYLFLTTALGDGYGGLEHKDSSALICKRDDLPKLRASAGDKKGKDSKPELSDGYRGFLGLCSHEYFHLWNVKRIKPACFTPYDLQREGYTRLLWAFEGITSYYDDLALVRAGVITVESYLELLGRTLTRVLKGRGRAKQSLADSSFDAWIKFYRPDENTPNAVVSYYTKGAITALALDLTIRAATDEARSLDDVMRLLWQRHGAKDIGVPEDGVEKIATEVAGVDLAPFFDEHIRGTRDLELQPLLSPYGIDLHLRPLESDHDQGGKPGKTPREEALQRGTLGVTLASGDDGARLAHVHDGSAAQQAGLSAGDVIVAVDGLRAGRGNLLRMIHERAPGTRLRVHAFRRDELLELDVVLAAPTPDAAYFTLRKDKDSDAEARRVGWLSGRSAR